MLAPGNGRTKTGSLWIYVAMTGLPVIQPRRPCVRLLARSQGREPTPASELYFRADAYTGFQQLYECESPTVPYPAQVPRDPLRPFVHASPITTEAIERIAALYAIEAEIRGSTPDVRKTVRQARARPLLDGLFLWLEQTLAKLSRKSDTAAGDPLCPLAPNRAHPLCRRTGSSRSTTTPPNARCASSRSDARNYLFCGSDAGGERAAQIYSLLGSAKLNGLDPDLYLHHVLERIADHPIHRIHQRLPWNESIHNTLPPPPPATK